MQDDPEWTQLRTQRSLPPWDPRWALARERFFFRAPRRTWKNAVCSLFLIALGVLLFAA